MRVLFINRMASMERGGGETFDLEIARHLQTFGCEISFLSGLPLFGGPRIRAPFSSFQFPVSSFHIRSPYLGWFPWDVVKGGWRLRVADYWMFEKRACAWALARQDRFDVVQVCELPTFVRSWKRAGGRLPVVMRLTAPNYYDPHGTIRLADGIIASGMTLEVLRSGSRPDAVDVPNSVDTELFHPQPSDFRVRHGIPAEAFVILYVARFQNFKNHALLIQAFARFLEKKPESRLVLVGSGPLRERTEGLCRQLGVAAKVLFMGEVAFGDMPAVYAACDLKAVSSTFESFCFAAIEAMATELPIVSTDCGWVPRLIDRDKGGIVVPQDDPAAFTQAMLDLASDRARRSAMGKFNRQVVLDKYGWKQNAGKLLELYERLLSTRREITDPH